MIISDFFHNILNTYSFIYFILPRRKLAKWLQHTFFTIFSIHTLIYFIIFTRKLERKEGEKGGRERERERERERKREREREREEREREGRERNRERWIEERDSKILKEKTILRNLMFLWETFSC